MKKYLGLALGVSAVVLAQSCSSDGNSTKTKAKFDGGSEAGEGGESATGGTAGRGGGGGSAGHAGSSGSGSSSAGEGGAMTSSGGAAGAAGETSSAGASGEGGQGPLTCAAGLADCDGDPTNACETSLDSVMSCGACKNACNGLNGTVACQDSACKLTSCNDGYADCDNKPETGCEQSLSANDHCGSCSRDCSAYGATCTTGRCGAVTIGTGLPFGSDSGGLDNWALSGSTLLEAGYYAYLIDRIPTDGSATSTLWTKSTAYIGNHSLIVLGTNVLWAERGTPEVMLTKPLTAAAATLPTVAFTPEYQPTFVRAQGTDLYWASGDYQAGEPGYIYKRSQSALATDAGTRIVTVDQGTHGAILDFNVTSDALYWVTSTAGAGTAYELRTAPLGGTPIKAVPAVPGAAATPITDGGAASTVAVRVLGKTVYFNYHVGSSALNGIYSFNAGDTAPKQLVQVTNAQSFEVDSSGIYYVDANVQGVFKAPLTGGAGVSISSAPYNGRVVALDSTFVYFVAPGCCQSSLYKLIK